MGASKPAVFVARRIFPDIVERLRQHCDHAVGQRVDGLRPVQVDVPDSVLDIY